MPCPLFSAKLLLLKFAPFLETQVVRSCPHPEHKAMFFADYVERVIQQHTSNLLNNGLRR